MTFSSVLLLSCTRANMPVNSKPITPPPVDLKKGDRLNTSTPDSNTKPNTGSNTGLNTGPAQFLPIAATATIAGRVVNLEIAGTFQEQAKGLMFRPALPDDRGMLFPFNPPRPVAFWMKNVPVSLDMVFIYQGKVAAIAHAAPPCTDEPCPIYPIGGVVVDRVIELRAGWAKAMGLKVGDRISVNPISGKETKPLVDAK